jgi:predicted membrane protein
MVRKSIGLFIVVVGILLFLSNIDIIRFSDIAKFLWPSLLVIIGLAGMAERGKVDIFYLIIALIGTSFLITNAGIVEKDVLSIILWPTIIIIIGVKMILHTGIFRSKSSSAQKSYTTVFGGIEEKNIDMEFENCEINAIFGGSQIDFRNIKLKKDKAYINVTAVFGGVELILPREHKIILMVLQFLEE